VLLIGVISASLVDRHHLPAWIRIGLVVGVIGGYTTFSTFAQEALTLIDAHGRAVALAYLDRAASSSASRRSTPAPVLGRTL